MEEDIIMNEEQLQLREGRRLAQREELEDMRDIVRSAAGFRFMARLLGRYGVGREAPEFGAGLHLYNEGQRLLGLLARADRKQALRLMDQIWDSRA